jgi:hypothetical protein
MLNKNKSSRYYKFEQISNHIWFKDFNWDALLSLDMKPGYKPLLANKKDNYSTKPYINYIQSLKELQKTKSKIQITEQDKIEFEEWIKNF